MSNVDENNHSEHGEMSRTQADELLRVLAHDHIEALDTSIAQRNKEKFKEDLEARLPGVSKEFDRLVGRLPDPNSINTREFPVAASVVRLGSDGKLEVISTSTNKVNESQDSTAHAELQALKEAQKVTGEKHLEGAFLLSTLEPCVMCCGAIANTEVSGLVYAAEHKDIAGKHALVNGEYKPYRTSPEGYDAKSYFSNHPEVEVVSGFMREEVLGAIGRTPVSMNEYYSDPDA